MKKNRETHWRSSLVTAAGVICLMIAASFFVTEWISRWEEEKSFEKLYKEADQLVTHIENHTKTDRESLEILAAVIAGYDDLESGELWELLDSYDTTGMMSGLGILMPDDTVIKKGGQRVDVSGKLSFAEESPKGAHLTDRQEALNADRGYVVRHYVPIVRDGQTVAMLYGVIDLEKLPEELRIEPYDGQAAFYIVDGSTGDFLVDTWHETTENIWALGERQLAPGYEHEQLKQGLIDGEQAYVVFVSKTIGEYLYFYYAPMEINAWRIALSVPENVVFAEANEIQRVLHLFLIFEVICFALYFAWILWRNTRSYRRIKEQGERDLLLGVYNRNRYELDRGLLEGTELGTFACVYIDVNGLHELNNASGHEAGDRMLQRVAEKILEKFGEEHSYRIGGDEFVVFVQDEAEEAVLRLSRELEEELKEDQIDVSVGIQWEQSPPSLDAVVKAAEEKMYAAKRAYYEQAVHDRRGRERSQI